MNTSHSEIQIIVDIVHRLFLWNMRRFRRLVVRYSNEILCDCYCNDPSLCNQTPLRTTWMGQTIKLTDFVGKCHISSAGKFVKINFIYPWIYLEYMHTLKNIVRLRSIHLKHSERSAGIETYVHVSAVALLHSSLCITLVPWPWAVIYHSRIVCRSKEETCPWLCDLSEGVQYFGCLL